jgi:hypothetical protein
MRRPINTAAMDQSVPATFLLQAGRADFRVDRQRSVQLRGLAL